MDISLDSYASNLASMYSSTTASQGTNLSDKISSTDYSQATDEELMDACKQFEAYFLEQLFKEMESTVDLTGDSEDSQLVDYFMDTTIQSLAETTTETQSLGLAQTLYESMKREYNI